MTYVSVDLPYKTVQTIHQNIKHFGVIMYSVKLEILFLFQSPIYQPTLIPFTLSRNHRYWLPTVYFQEVKILIWVKHFKFCKREKWYVGKRRKNEQEQKLHTHSHTDFLWNCKTGDVREANII